MSRVTWLPAVAGEHAAGYAVLTCHQVGSWFYTFVAMPAESDGPSRRRIEVLLPTGDPLPWRVYSGTGAEDGEIAYTRGKPPPDGVRELTVQVFDGDRLILSERMVRYVDPDSTAAADPS